MSYPQPRFLGEKGEVSAQFRPADHRVSPGISYLASSESTGGEFGLYKVDMGPRATGAQEHFHRSISESFYVLSGEMRFYDGDRWTTGGEGDFFHVPVGGLHAFRNETDEPVSLLMLFTPGAPREEYFERVAEFTERGPDQLRSFQLRHDSLFT